jgi:hypothetical protein
MPLCLDSRLTDGGKVVSPTHRPRSTPQKHYFLFLILISLRGRVNSRVQCGRKDYVHWKKCIHLIGSRTLDLPASNIVPSAKQSDRLKCTSDPSRWEQCVVPSHAAAEFVSDERRFRVKLELAHTAPLGGERNVGDWT